MTGSVSHPNAGRVLCVFLSFRVISAFCDGQEEIMAVNGELNCKVALNGASERENPSDVKSFHDIVWRLVLRSCTQKQNKIQKKGTSNEKLTVRALSVRSN